QGSGGTSALDRGDAFIVAALLLVFSPLYLLNTYGFPHQINTDELAILGAVRKLWGMRAPELISDYFRFPSLVFLGMGGLCELLGGISWAHLRVVHAGLGLMTVALAYPFFRAFFDRAHAAASAAVIGLCHSLVVISRMAMRQNSTLFVELSAFNLLYRGLVAGNALYSFFGGA